MSASGRQPHQLTLVDQLDRIDSLDQLDRLDPVRRLGGLDRLDCFDRVDSFGRLIRQRSQCGVGAVGRVPVVRTLLPVPCSPEGLPRRLGYPLTPY